MALFRVQGSSVSKIHSTSLDLERHLQNIFEKNLEELLNITFVAHEYSTSFGGRIDTLGIDKSGCPCIIEYKRSQNDNVINQGLSYLRWLQDHKAEFEQVLTSHYKETKTSPMNVRDEKDMTTVEVDWDSPRVICIAESYNRFDMDAADILPIRIELYKYKLYEEGLLLLETDQYKKGESAGTKVQSKKTAAEVLVQKTYHLDDHIRKANDETKQLFYALRERILGLDDEIKEEPKKKYIAYKLSTNIVDVVVYMGTYHGLKIFLNVKSGELLDTKNVARDLTKPRPIGHWGNGDYEVRIDSIDTIDAAFELIKQSYNLNR